MKIKNYIDKRFLRFYLIDLIYFILTFGFIFFALYKLNQYATILKSINVDQALTQNFDVDVNALANMLNLAGPLTNKILLLFYSMPIIVIILYILLQGLSWSKLTGIKYRHYLWRFLLTTIVFALLIYIIFLLADTVNLGIVLDIIILLLVYILSVTYSTLKGNIFRDLKKSFILSFKKFHPLFLIYIIWLIANVVILFIYTISKGFLSIIATIVTLLILIALFTLFKRILCNFTSKHN